jgi:hypothetical protein
LPVNNGTESIGESIVIDFESTYFIGTLLLRIKQATPASMKQNNSKQQQSTGSYFDGKKRKFQAVVQGTFKKALPMSQCVTGQAFDRPAGKLPARWIVTAFIKFISTLAPQLEATIDGNKPRFLSPLVSTAHTVLVENGDGQQQQQQQYSSIEELLGEPPSVDTTSIMAYIPEAIVIGVPDTTRSSVAHRMKVRKKVFNKIASQKLSEPRFDTSKKYTFEFYQHLLDFGPDGLAVDMGRLAGKVPLAPATDGQPIKIMAAHKDEEGHELDTLWSFDVWHESLYPLAVLDTETTGKH